jgi:hypothetical protein
MSTQPTRRLLSWDKADRELAPDDIEKLVAQTNFKVIGVTSKTAFVEGEESKIAAYAGENGWRLHPEVKFDAPVIDIHLTDRYRDTP